MWIISNASYRRLIALTLPAVFVIVGVQLSSAETAEEAIRRIQAGQYTPMPPPSTAPATGLAGKGMTVENGTGYTLHITNKLSRRDAPPEPCEGVGERGALRPERPARPGRLQRPVMWVWRSQFMVAHTDTRLKRVGSSRIEASPHSGTI